MPSLAVRSRKSPCYKDREMEKIKMSHMAAIGCDINDTPPRSIRC